MGETEKQKEIRKLLGIPDPLEPHVGGLVDSLAERVATTWRTNMRVTLLSLKMESPIEQMFYAVWEFMMPPRVGYSCLILEPQKPVEVGKRQYRVDFGVSLKTDKEELVVLPVGIEIEGHDYHERDKAKVAADNKRERAIEQIGIHIVRFSGSEVFKNPYRCVAEAIATIETLDKRRRGI